MKRALIIAGVVVLLLAYIVWRSQPEQVLKRRSKALIGMADQVSGGVGLFDLNRLEGLIADELRFQVDVVSGEFESASLAEVVSGYQWMGENTRKSDFKIEEFKSISIDGDRARVKCRVEGVLEMSDIRMMEGLHRVEFAWRKDKRGDWRLEELVWK